MKSNLDVIVSAQQIDQRIVALSRQIAEKLEPDAVVVGLLQGAFIFMADLIRGLAQQGRVLRTDFLWLSSYGDGQESTGRIHVLADLQKPINGCQILLVDDVYDTGRTILFAKGYLATKGAKEVLTCLLARKPLAKTLPPPDFLGFDLPNRFIVGYGLDDAGGGRGLPDICASKL
ncbi:phosphoribosyltransferase [Candidatus Phycosocius spiralis]|uniref:Hypoxanthine phosphoribosyltransferase n=1 Tax=Candidatus Phycosocius spiralis TaxID=2815099 RepID=A0ABQ4PUV6_9PROT|nr:phosphoribosyltransferase family protein [Candidatus Phycosocius spiralis]GIU66763.1 hypoxanthine phosphoribosyltransferase [Candidatus Phycosocius spiralis]